ncbi:hypothetical protein FJT64_013884 [Amphibalanus amphitrite]|uniref:Uncharacterized protein n=1 Tax=Amphibalanus amphitrite TaxID=1232801 RepID=A0A6A4V291_AMPAM|nr:hypothetical protein FJT64_013884 [Amphibalanus amphitrite]
MNSVLSTLGFGTRYCVVSDDHERPEVYSDDHSRAPQSAIERLTDFDTLYDKFSSGSARVGRATEEESPRVRRRQDDTSPGQTVLALFDRLAQRHSRTEISSFDRQFPLSGRPEPSGARLAESRPFESPRAWVPFDRSAEAAPDWHLPRVSSPSPSPSVGSSSSASSGPGQTSSSAAEVGCPHEGLLIDLSE